MLITGNTLILLCRICSKMTPFTLVLADLKLDGLAKYDLSAYIKLRGAHTHPATQNDPNAPP